MYIYVLCVICLLIPAFTHPANKKYTLLRAPIGRILSVPAIKENMFHCLPASLPLLIYTYVLTDSEVFAKKHLQIIAKLCKALAKTFWFAKNQN